MPLGSQLSRHQLLNTNTYSGENFLLDATYGGKSLDIKWLTCIERS